MGFNRNVHLLGALITNDAFDSALRHNEHNAVQSETHQTHKSTVILNNYPADSDSKLAAFKQRNLGTARNMIGLNSGYALRIQNQHYDDGVAKTYYGPVIGVCEVMLLTLREGEGGGYVYAKNIHSATGDFLQTSGNFVFPGITHNERVQYVVDDCFPKSFSGNSSDAEAHYWYVEGDKYFFNTTMTGYTFKKQTAADRQTFHLTTNDNNVLLSGVDSSKKLRVKSVTWDTTSYPVGYQTDLKDISSTGYTPTSVSAEPPYSFAIKVGDVWTDAMSRSNMAQQAAKAYTNGSDVLPIFDIELQDYVSNDGEDYYNTHLAQPENVTVVLEALDGSDIVVGTYTVNIDIAYVLGPSYTGHVSIGNCALPGERIAFGSDGITVTTSDQMPITGTGWKLCPPGNNPGTWDAASLYAIDIPRAQYDSDLSGGSTTGWIHAQRKYEGWNIAYTFTAGGHTFTVWPDQSLTDAGGNTIPDYAKHLVVHNYYSMADVLEDGELYYLHPGDGARIYISNEKDLRAFFTYLNTIADGNEHTAADGHAFTVPASLAGIHIILLNDIMLTEPLPLLTRSFAGTFHGDGYTINLNNNGSSLFADKLTGSAMVYNLGMIGGSITSVANATENSFVVADTDEFRYGSKAYQLSHHFTLSSEYITSNRYAGTDWQYARPDGYDSRMLRTAALPNYGSTMTAHSTAHTPAAIEAHDCLFFGQTLSPEGQANAPYPQHLSDEKADGSWVEDNRVHEAAGYYRSKTAGSFYYNKAAWALQPGLTAVSFASPAVMPTSFGNSNADDDTKAVGIQHVTKNLLVYAPSDVTKAQDSDNYFMVTGTPGSYTCADLALVDKEDFNAPCDFTATKASYERQPADFVETSGTAWEGICLPFAPTATSLSDGIVRHQDSGNNAMIYALNNMGQRELRHVNEGETQRDITFFWGDPTEAMLADPTTNDRTLNHEYWLRSLVSVTVPDASPSGITADFQRPASYAFAAYTPYVVSFPGERFYEFNMTGQTVSFSADNAVVGVTDDAITSTTANGYSYVGTFLHKTGEYGINDEGTAFISDQAILPFRTYIQQNSPYQLHQSPGNPLQQLAKGIIYIGNTVNNEQLTVNNGQLTVNNEQLTVNNGQLTMDNGMSTDYLIIRAIGSTIEVESSHDCLLPCHGISGTTIAVWQIRKGINTFTNLRSGIYLIAGKKLVIR